MFESALSVRLAYFSPLNTLDTSVLPTVGKSLKFLTIG